LQLVPGNLSSVSRVYVVALKDLRSVATKQPSTPPNFSRQSYPCAAVLGDNAVVLTKFALKFSPRDCSLFPTNRAGDSNNPRADRCHFTIGDLVVPVSGIQQRMSRNSDHETKQVIL